MRKQIIFFIVCILILTSINEVFLKSKSINNTNIEPDYVNPIPSYPPTDDEENPLSKDAEKENIFLAKDDWCEKNKSFNDISNYTNKELRNAPILNNINEIDGHFIENPEQIEHDLVSDLSVLTLPEQKGSQIILEETKILQNANRINGYFTENKGQVGSDSVRFYIQNGGVWFLNDGVVFEIREEISMLSQIPKSQDSRDMVDPLEFLKIPESKKYKSVVIKVNFDCANEVQPVGRGRLSCESNFFYSNESSKWCTNVKNYKEIIYQNLYDNIDLRYYLTVNGLKYDFIIHPGGNSDDIKLRIEGANSIHINSNGNLGIKTEMCEIEDSKLYIYQETNNERRIIEGGFEILNSKIYGFNILGKYDITKDIIIDPLLNYSTYLGGSLFDMASEIEIDSKGNAVVSGYTFSLDFPTTPGVYNRTHKTSSINPNWDIFVSKLNSNGSALIFSTYIGGTHHDYSYGLKLDKNGTSYIAGNTNSSDFPVTVGAYNTTYDNNSIVIIKLSQNGSSLLYSTFLGGNGTGTINYSGIGNAYDIDVDSMGNAYITGATGSSNFFVTTGAYDTSYGGNGDAFMVKLNFNGSKLLYSTFLGGSNADIGWDIILDSNNNAYITGMTNSSNFPSTPGSFDRSFNGIYDCFIVKLNENGSKLIYSTFTGGTQSDYGFGIFVDKEDNAYITGMTQSSNFPTTSGAYCISNNGNYDAFILKLNPNGSALNYSTFIGGNNYEIANDITVDANGNVFVSGLTYSSNFPTTLDAYDRSYNGFYDIFIIKVSSNGSNLLYSTYLGGSNYEDAIEIELFSERSVYIAGHSYSSNFPTTSKAYDTSFNGVQDCIIAQIYFKPINAPPVISSFTATKAPEGSKVHFTVNASDPDNDPLTYYFDFQNDSIFDYVGKNNTASYIWGDDYNGTAVVNVSDGNSETDANTTVVVANVAPIIEAISIENITNFSQDFEEKWVANYDGPGYGDDVAESIAVDLAGNVYVTGWSNSIEPPFYKNSNYNFTTIKYDPNGKEIWRSIYNSAGGRSMDRGLSIVVDLLGNAYVLGLSVDLYKGGNDYNFTTIKYDQYGNEKWVAIYDGGGTDIPVKIVIDHQSYIYVTGASQFFNKTSNKLNSDRDFITIKYDSNGNQKWLRRYNRPPNWHDGSQDMVVGSDNNIYILGNSGIQYINGTYKPDSDYTILSYDPSGNLRWTASYDGTGKSDDISSKIALDSNNNVYVTGWSYGNGTNYDYATIAYNSSGTKLWVARYDGPHNYFDIANDLAVGPSGNIYVIGQCHDSSKYSNYTTVAYNKNGTELWVREYYNNQYYSWDIPGRITVDPIYELIFVTGGCFKNGTGDDITTIIYDKFGKEIWVGRYNGPTNGNDHPHDIILDNFGNVYVTGYSNEYNNYPLDRNFTTIKYSIINNYECYEGSEIRFNASALDYGSDDLIYTWILENGTNITNIYYNNGLGPDPCPSTNGTFPFSVNDTINYTFPDDGIYNITLTVTDDDGLNSTYLTRIIVKNVAPKVNVSVFKTKIDKKQSANLSVRIAGEKWHDVKVELYKNGNEITNGSLIRYPGSPNEQMLHFLNQTLDSSSNWTAILYYTPDDDPVNGQKNGATPCWVILNLSNGKQLKLHHTFKVKHKKTHIWRVNLTKVLPSNGNSSRKGTFNVTVFDPGADNITLYLDFGDGTNITKFYPNNNQTFPVSMNLTLFHNYTSGGPFSIILIAKDNDGGITTVKITVDFG